MIFAFYFTGILLFLFGSIYTGFKCFDWYRKYIADKYQTNQHHFLSDLYKLQTKWAGAGEFGYSESLSNLIKLHGNLDKKPRDGGVGLPLTNDGLSTDIQLKNRRKEEFVELANDWIKEF